MGALGLWALGYGVLLYYSTTGVVVWLLSEVAVADHQANVTAILASSANSFVCERRRYVAPGNQEPTRATKANVMCAAPSVFV